MRRSLALTLLVLLVAACGGTASGPTPTAAPSAVATTVPLPDASSGGPRILPILASAEFAPGPNRFLFSLTDRDNKLLAAPDVGVRLAFYDMDVDKDAVAFEADARFMWAVEDVSGLYVASAPFTSGGRWGTRFWATFPDGRTETVRLEYDVLDESVTPGIGEPAPAADTPTSADVSGDLAAISTDPDPEPRFYDLSVSQALAAKEPFVVVFATPAFCESATCGPTLETVKAVAADNPDLTFIHAEPYIMETRGGSLQPVLNAEGHLQPAPWIQSWDLLTEPFVAIVDADGKVRAKFEGVVARDELDAAIGEL